MTAPVHRPETTLRSAGPWIAAAFVVAISLLSTFTLSDDNTQVAANAGQQASGGDLYAADKVYRDDQGNLVDASGNAVPDEVGAGTGGRQQSGGGSTTGGSGLPTKTGGTGGTTNPNVDPITGKTYDCAKGQNAGATAPGVTARQIQFAATVVKTGIAKDFLSDAQFGMDAVIAKVNRAGGVCGRLIKVKYDNDGWDQTTGQRIIEKYIAEGTYFGLAVNPSSEGLRGAIDSGLIKNSKFPVVGADGMLRDQYTDPWVWPVATSTRSVMHIMAKDAKTRGANKFAIVYETSYRFGEEGYEAFVKEVGRLGGTIVKTQGLSAGERNPNAANAFVNACSESGQDLKKCDFIAVLLEPATATQWVRDGGLGNGIDRPAKGIGAAQPLFVTSFARDCGKFCADMRVWTSFKPNIEPFSGEPAVATYAADLRNVSEAADANNPHVEGAYVGMKLLVAALEKLGAAPTREGIKAVLDKMTLDTGLTPPITFSSSNHYAAISAQAFEAVVNGNAFNNWRYSKSGFIQDTSVNEKDD